MDIIVYSDKQTWIHRLDPRGRVLAACVVTAILAVSQDRTVLVAGLLLGVLAVVAARVPVAAILQRLVPLNALLVLLLGLLLFFTPGEMIVQVGPATATREGFMQGATIWLKANAIVLLLAALLGTIELVALGHALARLRVPARLTHLLLFTVRYLGLMLKEYERLARAAQLRGFAPGLNHHTLRTTGYMAGMILVRSYARGERIRDAMRLRGYQGTLVFRGEMAFQKLDVMFAALAVAVLAILLGLESQ